MLNKNKGQRTNKLGFKEEKMFKLTFVVCVQLVIITSLAKIFFFLPYYKTKNNFYFVHITAILQNHGFFEIPELISDYWESQNFTPASVEEPVVVEKLVSMEDAPSAPLMGGR